MLVVQKQSQVVRVSLTCARAAFESAMFLFTTTAVPVKKKGPGIRHFLIALVKPIDQRKDLKPAVTPELVQTMSSYVPQFIMKDVCKQPQPRREPEIQRFPACILFIDVSGTGPTMCRGADSREMLACEQHLTFDGHRVHGPQRATSKAWAGGPGAGIEALKRVLWPVDRCGQ